MDDDKSLDPNDSLHTVEGGKKDPSIRRQELLVKSGLVEVCLNNIYSL